MLMNQYNWTDYCTCHRCPCCGKIVRQQPLTQIWGGSNSGDAPLNCGTSISNTPILGTPRSINDPENAKIKKHIECLIAENKLVVS